MPVQVLGLRRARRRRRVRRRPRRARPPGPSPRPASTGSAWQPRSAATPGAHGGAKLEDIFEQIQRGEVATLNLILKADVTGSLEALTESLRKLERDEVKLAFVHRGVGGITENDVQLAAASNATIIGFNVRPDRKARELAEAEDVEIRTYEIIYQVLEDIENAMVGMLAPEFEEVVTGEAEVREIFSVPRVGAIAGCYVLNGTITRGSKVRFLREGTIIWKGAITSLRRFKDDVREVHDGLRVRHRPHRLPGPQAGRHHRDLRGAGDPAQAERRGPAAPTACSACRRLRRPAALAARPSVHVLASKSTHLPRRVAQGQAGGREAHRRGRPAPLPRGRRRGRPPGPVAAGGARRSRVVVGRPSVTPPRSSTRSSASCGRSPRCEVRVDANGRWLGVNRAAARPTRTAPGAARYPRTARLNRAAPRDPRRGARAHRRRAPRAGHRHRGRRRRRPQPGHRVLRHAGGEARRRRRCSRRSASTASACRPPSAARRPKRRPSLRSGPTTCMRSAERIERDPARPATRHEVAT